MRLAMLALVLGCATAANAATYYVRTDGNNANLGTANTAGGAWLTIDKGADTATAGDVVRVQAGTYAERVTPLNSGTSGNTITLIADGAVTFCGMDISSKNYIRVIGFTIDTDAGACTKGSRAFDFGASGTSTGWEFWHNTITNADGCGICGSDYPPRQNNFVIIGNTFSLIGGVGNNGSAVSIRGSNNLIAYNDVTPTPDAFQVDGLHNFWLNNYIHGTTDPSDLHADVFQSNSSKLGMQDNLIEANFAVGNGALANEHGVLIQHQGGASCEGGACGTITEQLFRRNVWHNISGGSLSANGADVGSITNVRLVHETVVDADRTASGIEYTASFYGTNAVTGWVFNSLHYRGWGSSVTSGVAVYYVQDAGAISGANYNLAYTPDATPTYAVIWTSQTNEQSNVTPNLVNVAADDFHLGAGSGDGSNARGTAGPLTTAASCAGTTLTVASGGGGFFRGPNTSIDPYSAKLTAGDTITVGSTTRTVVSIVTDAITVDTALSCSNGDPVYLGSDTTPDIGAYPYSAGGYSLSATYTINGGTATIAPSDSTLVRFVVCYDSSVPTAVVNASPYTCSVGSGTFSARVYPRYASQTLWQNATLTGSGGRLRLRVGIRPGDED